ncbi:MAG: hypothetical protein COB98_08945 [Flavobacteriaceae bacterium]|nr:MAG: hypothetical protein COB98_08945 [Flavobacteriaceae bacterium]
MLQHTITQFLNNTPKYLCIIIILFLGSFHIHGQTLIYDSDLNNNTTAAQGDLYKHNTSAVVYIGLRDGSYHPILTNLQEILAQANDAATKKITNLGTPTDPKDAVTKEYVDNLTGGGNWLMVGNAPTNTSSFLGTTNDVKMQIRSNNISMLEFGRRQTLGLVQSFPDYQTGNQPLVHINGDGNTAALQFAASAANFYKPMFFTTLNGNFRLKGSSGKTDFFEIGSSGPDNEGRLEFVIGDDGDEPIIFKRYDYRGGKFHQEFFRVQGSNNTAGAKTRFGININTAHKPIVSDYSDDANSGYNIANSTLEVNGSLALSILKTTGNLILTEDHHTIIIDGNHTIGLPNVSTSKGRNYILKNPTNNTITVSNYKDTSGNNNTEIPTKTILFLQSDGSNWQQINNSNTSNGTTPTLNVTKETIGYVFAASYVYFDGWNNGLNINVTDASIVKTNTGRYSVTFTSPHPNGEYYVITFGYKGDNQRDGRIIQVRNQTSNGFTIDIITGDNTAGPDTYVDSIWYFSVPATKEVVTNVTLN